MLIKVDCKTCKIKHFDHYECDNCNYNFSSIGLGDCKIKKLYKYCPMCGKQLYIDSIMELK